MKMSLVVSVSVLVLVACRILMALPMDVVMSTDTPAVNEPAYVSPVDAVVMNRRLVLKQLPSGQFALTVQSLEPGVLGGPFVISNSDAADTSTCNVTVESSCEPDISNRHVCHTSSLVTSP